MLGKATKQFYSRVSNKRAAQIINFLKNSNLHGLITCCTFINFRKFSNQHGFYISVFWKIPTCTVLLHPAHLLILRNFPTCMIITSCTFIRYPRVIRDKYKSSYDNPHVQMRPFYSDLVQNDVFRCLWADNWNYGHFTSKYLHIRTFQMLYQKSRKKISYYR